MEGSARYRVSIAVLLLATSLAMIAAPQQSAGAASGCFGMNVTNGVRMDVPEIDEASGLVLSRRMPGVMWTHNDNDEAAGSANNRIYAVDGRGDLLATVQFNLSSQVDIVPGATFVELEDIAFGPGPNGDPNYLYLADTGDNNPTRPYASVYRFREPLFTPDSRNPITINVAENQLETTRFRYESFLDPNKTRPRNVEAMFVDPASGSLFLIEKALHAIDANGRYLKDTAQPRISSYVHRISAGKLFPANPAKLRLATIVSHIRAQFDVTTFGVTAADISADGTIIAVKNREETFYWVRDPNESVVATFEGAHVAPCLAPTGMRGESLAIGPTSDRFMAIREGLSSPIWTARFTNQDHECFGKPATILGTAGDDVITGTAGNDVIVTFGGNDRVEGKRGADRICLGPGDDYASGDKGKDRIDGGWGNDTIQGGKGYDILWGQDGVDTINGGAHDDRIYGGDGRDVLDGRSAHDILKGGRGADRVSGGAGDDALAGGAGVDGCDGGDGTDTATSCEVVTGVP